MRTIDADALKELFSEVIGHIAKKPKMNGNLEHMIRASAMVIQMIDDAPTVQPDTTTHDSIPAETGKNDGDRTSGDCISRQAAIDALKEKVFRNLTDEFYGAMQVLDELPSVQPETNCSEIPNNSDTISRQAVKDIFTELYGISAIGSVFDKYEWADICETTVNELPPIQPTLYGYNIGHLELIARALQKEDLPPERIAEVLTDIGRIVAIVSDEFEETLRKAVEQCTT